jgi:general secretion pathway protein H
MVQLAAMVKTPTFAPNPDRQRLRAKAPINTPQRGFTLIELLVVLAIAGLLLALTPMAYNKVRDSAQYTTVLRTAVSDMRQARQHAMMHGLSVTFFVDLAGRKYGLAGSTAHTLPEPLQMRATVGSEQLQQERVASIEFLPDGGASGGSIEVIRPNGAGTRLRVDWLSGQVTQEQLLP